MGSKRVGLARVEALLEAQAREIAWGGTTTFKGARRAIVDGSAGNVTLTAADSGALVVCSGAARTVTLPAPTAGVTYTMVSASDDEHILQTAGTNVMYGFVYDLTAGTTIVGVDVRAKGTLTTVSCQIGDRIEIDSDGTNWYIVATLDETPTFGTH